MVISEQIAKRLKQGGVDIARGAKLSGASGRNSHVGDSVSFTHTHTWRHTQLKTKSSLVAVVHSGGRSRLISVV